MSPGDRVLYFIGERLGLSIVAVERMSSREVRGWIRWFDEAQRQATAAQDDALDPRAMSKADLRRAFS